MKTIAIIGGGFAGLAAAISLQNKVNANIVLIDRYENTHFRPLLPDTISGKIPGRYLLYPIIQLRENCGFQFICANIEKIDLEKNIINCSDLQLNFDYLIVACGSSTPLPPDENIRKLAHKVDSIHDGLFLADSISCSDYKEFIICGGGYTGVEVASQLSNLSTFCSRNCKITIVELTESLLGTLPVWMQKYAHEQLSKAGIQIVLNTKVTSVRDDAIQLSNNQILDHALLVWTTGLKASPLTQTINSQKDHSGRIMVDSFLKFKENCFAAGDCAHFSQRESTLRMSVQASIDMGKCAAQNIVNLINKRPLERFHPFDPGFIIPMRNGIACGEVFGYKVQGYTATFLHYLMSAYRSHGILNRAAVISAILKK